MKQFININSVESLVNSRGYVKSHKIMRKKHWDDFKFDDKINEKYKSFQDNYHIIMRNYHSLNLTDYVRIYYPELFK